MPLCFVLWSIGFNHGYLHEDGFGTTRWNCMSSPVGTQLRTMMPLSQELSIANSSEVRDRTPYISLLLTHDSWLTQSRLTVWVHNCNDCVLSRKWRFSWSFFSSILSTSTCMISLSLRRGGRNVIRNIQASLMSMPAVLWNFPCFP